MKLESLMSSERIQAQKDKIAYALIHRYNLDLKPYDDNNESNNNMT
jgi:hypothetical protein